MEITGKLKGIENDGIIILTDGGKKSFSVKKEVIEQLQGKMLKTVTVQISNNIVVKLLDILTKGHPSSRCRFLTELTENFQNSAIVPMILKHLVKIYLSGEILLNCFRFYCSYQKFFFITTE